MRVGALQRAHRERLREILDATAVFRPDEVQVALELFDSSELDATVRGTAEADVGAAEPSGRDTGAGNPDYEFIGAFDEEGHLVGYACFGATPGTDRTYDLYWIAMHPALHGRGGGSRLLHEVEARLRARGARLIVVETSSRDAYAPTRRFYESRGYAEVARLHAFYAADDDRVIYRKAVRGTSSHPPTERGVRDE
ncbi:MAG TPA: GNAT family N-acetyltransferase [Gemmatimonadaceae bacterium]|nr:GNAT family N-acetyltransferase [Gemmatimonadaceae bacterium]